MPTTYDPQLNSFTVGFVDLPWRMPKPENNNKELESRYNPHGLENKWYPLWEKRGLFSWRQNLSRMGVAEKDLNSEQVKADKNPFCIVIPPPNVTGSLHLGHALNHTIQDILTRYHRMKGDLTLWLPGTDHAGIATQNVVEKLLAKDNIKRWDLSRKDFEKKVWQWKDESGGMINHQQRELGESVDWDYHRFTMDDGLSAIVKKVFVQLYDEKLIYRAERIINWCPRCVTALSNIEVEHSEKKGKLYYIKYLLADTDNSSEKNFLTIATTRPETLLGDEAVAVNPSDDRYKDFVGKKVILPLMGKEIPVIVDDYVDVSFGTGALKITPSHDPNDFEVGKRHKLPLNRVLDDNGNINENGGKYQGLSREKARKQIIIDLEEAGLLEKTEDHTHNVGSCYRCQNIIEPLTSLQWFVNVSPLAKQAKEAVTSGQIEFVPKRWENTYFDWMNKINDWCISRQLWWGHRIPAWYDDEGEVYVGESEEQIRKKYSLADTKLTHDEDVLDTWFSSGLWPFSTLMQQSGIEEGSWPEATDELKLFYPNSVLVTGFDIIFFWVARMIMFGMHIMKKPPFEKVYIHGLVRDATRQKMSKSKGNVVNPLEKMNEFGTDAFRFFLISILPEGKDIVYDESRLKGYSAFCNKIWNTARFIWMNQESSYTLPETPTESDPICHWIIDEFNTTLKAVEDALENFRFAEYTKLVYDFIWKSFCDNYIELAKVSLKDEKSADATRYYLNAIFVEALKLLHPIMPFITEELFTHWSKNDEDLIIISNWPEKISFESASKANEIADILHIVYKIRNLRGELTLPPAEKFSVSLALSDSKRKLAISDAKAYIIELARLSEFTIIDEGASSQGVQSVCNFGKIYLDAGDAIDTEKEKIKLEKERLHLEKGIQSLEGRLGSKKFTENAPKEIVAQEQERLEYLKNKHQDLLGIIESL